MNKLRWLLKRLRQGFVILLITLSLTEIVFRCYNYFRPSFIFYDTSYNRFRGKANAPDYDFHLNSKGFKDVEFKVQKEKGTHRVLGLGDSFAFGVVPYQHNYLTLLEENLNVGDKKTELINMGIVATGPQDYLGLLAEEGLALKPDMVLVSFFIGNDFAPERTVRRLYRYSYVASFFAYAIAAAKGYQGQIIHGPSVYDDNAPTFTDPVFIEWRTREAKSTEEKTASSNRSLRLP